MNGLKRVSVLGCGRWGSFLAWYANRQGHTVTLWGRPGSRNLAEFAATRRSSLLELPGEISLTDDLATAAKADIIIISISAQQLRSFLRQLGPLLPANVPLVLCMKGLEEGTGCRLTQIVQQELPGTPCAVWVGPGHVQDFTQGHPNCMVIDSSDETLKMQIAEDFGGDLIRFYYGTDLIGNEVGAAAKNVVGIAAGVLDGLDRTSLKGALMARGAREVARLIKAMGGSELTAYGLGHLGDYEATVFSPYSHNRAYGEALAKGEPYGSLAEGVATAKSMLELSHRYGVELPICQAVCHAVYNGQPPAEMLAGLFERDLKREF